MPALPIIPAEDLSEQWAFRPSNFAALNCSMKYSAALEGSPVR